MTVLCPSEPQACLELWRAPTAWGEFWAALTRDGALAALAFPATVAHAARDEAVRSARLGHPNASIIEKAEAPVGSALRRQLAEYLAGQRRQFDLQLALGRRSDFSIAVWQAAAAIPHGRRLTYGELARRIGKPGAARAVGQALGRNPVPLAVPCHRVVQGDGTLGGFSGGAGWKERLLGLEATSMASGG